MSYIGSEPTSVAFLTDTYSGNGVATAFTMSVAPASTTSMLVVITGVTQDPSTYTINGTTLTFSTAPPTGTNNISIRYLGIPASNVPAVIFPGAVSASTTNTVTNKISVTINGTTYYLLASTSST